MVGTTIAPEQAEEASGLVLAAIEATPPQRQVLFLVKLALALASLVGDRARVTKAIQAARQEA